ncbi:FG-GAP-like repeat-containing protein, partial [Nodularia spumigena]
NGDGKDDIVAFGLHSVYVALSNGNGFNPKQLVLNNFGVQQGWSSQNIRPRQLGDVDGDGRVDIIGFGNNNTYIAFGQSDGTFSQPIAQNLGLSAEDTIANFEWYPRLVGDVNGDNRADIVHFGWAGVEVALSTSHHKTYDLWGVQGPDTFVTEAGVIKIIKDFERGVDKIDMAQAQVNQISFDYAALPGSTIIKVNGTERARVEGSLVDSISLINTSNDIKPQTLTPAQVKNISAMLQKWAESYATSLGLSTNNVQLVNNNLQMVGGDLRFIDWGSEQTQTNQGLQIENMTRNASMLFRNNSTESSSVTFSYSDGKGYEVSNQDTSEWTIGNSIGANASATVGFEVSASADLIFGSASATASASATIGASYEHNWSNGGSNTKIHTDNVNTQQDTSIQFNAPARAVTKAIATATGGEYSGGKYEIPITISGTIGIDLNGDGDALDTNEINNLPINAILQYYNPQQFVGEGLQRAFTLPQGQVLLYNETTKAKVTGTADGAFFTNVDASVASAYDWSLTNPTISEYLNGVNYQAVGQSVEERYWLIRNSQYGSRPSDTTLRIDGFNPAEDFIGIQHRAINSEADILFATGVGVGIDPADKLILKAGSYRQDNSTFRTTQILMGGTGDLTTIDDNDVLAELIGVAPHELLGSSSRESLTRGDMTSNFMFGIEGTIWDNSLASGNGTNVLQLLQTV